MPLSEDSKLQSFPSLRNALLRRRTCRGQPWISGNRFLITTWCRLSYG